MTKENEQARLLTCIGEPTRLQILSLLIQGERYVGEISETLRIEQSLVSYHLRHLRECNIVQARQDAQKTYYRLSDPRLAELVLISAALAKDMFFCQPGAKMVAESTREVSKAGGMEQV